MKNKTYAEHSALIVAALQETIFNKESDFYCGMMEEPEEGEEIDFEPLLHALINVVPTHIFNWLMEQDNDWLSINHLGVRLIIQNQTKP